MRSRLPPLPLTLAALVVAAGCARDPVPLTVHAAASLTSVLPRVADTFSPSSGPVRFHFGASSRLAKQIEAGAPGDVFFSADAAWMDYLETRGLLRAGTRRDLLGNRLVVVVPRSSSLALSSLADLAGPAVARVALAGEGVPAGRYARAALTHAGVLDAVAPKVASADDVRMALAWVARGEADAGIVYVSDAEAEPRVKVVVSVPADAHPPIVLPAAVLASSRRPDEAAAFLAHCEQAEARALFVAAGFSVRPGAP